MPWAQLIPGHVACSIFNSQSFETGLESVPGPWTIVFAFGQIRDQVDSVGLHPSIIEQALLSAMVH